MKQSRYSGEKRPTIPRVTKEAVLREFNHRCALCGADRPQLHHIDEDRANNDQHNLIPLCPNHHLSDQHDASNAIPIAKLQFFREHKHRHILKPQFNALFRRMAFLSQPDIDGAEAQTRELCAFVRHLSMGTFYAEQIDQLLERPPSIGMFVLGGYPDPQREQEERNRSRAEDAAYLQKLRTNRAAVEQLVVESLDFQVWPDSPRLS